MNLNPKKPLVDAAKLQPVTIDPVLPLERLTVSDMSADWMPPAARDLVEAAHASMNIPRVMMIAAITGAIAAAVQGKAKVRVGPAWTEHLSIWWLVFCSSASMKSKCVELAIKPILEYQKKLDEEVKPKANLAKARRAALEAHIKDLAKSAAKMDRMSPDRADKESELKYVSRELADHVVPSVPRLIKTEITPMMLTKRMKANQEADGYARLAIITDEAAFLMNMLGRFGKDGAILETLLAGWNGGHVSEDRRGESAKEIVEANLDRAHITLCCIVQPSVLDKLKACDDLSDKGFFGRCMLHHTAGGTLPPYGTPDIPKPVLEAYSAMVTRLLEWDPGEEPYEVNLLCHWDVIEEAYDRVRVIEQDDETTNSAWLRRGIGRACRIAALYRLAAQIGCNEPGLGGVASSVMDSGEFPSGHRNLSNLSNLDRGQGGSGGSGGGLVRESQILKYHLSNLFNDLAFMQTVERPTESTDSLAVRTLHSLSRSGKFQVGQLFKGRYLSKLLKQNMTVVNPILDRLEDLGHIEKVDERSGKRGPAAAVYRVRTLDWMGDFRPKPTAVQAEPLDPYLDSLPEPDAEPEPEPDLTVDETADPAEDWWRE